MTDHKVGTREEWLAARAELLEREKELTQMGDGLTRQLRDLPWVPVEKEYTFQTADGPKTLAALFDGRSQLVIYHFMFGPSYTAGCPTNSSIADSFNGVIPHLAARDVTMICVSGAPIKKLIPYERRMDWSFPWASSAGSDFNFDFGISNTEDATRAWVLDGELPPVASRNARASGTDIVSYLSEGYGVNTFAREGDTVYHCYSSTARGVEFLMGYYPILDRAPRGRGEGNAFQLWIRRHDEYDSE